MGYNENLEVKGLICKAVENENLPLWASYKLQWFQN